MASSQLWNIYCVIIMLRAFTSVISNLILTAVLLRAIVPASQMETGLYGR